MTGGVRTRDVFVAGGMPTITYRSRRDLEDQVRRHLDYGNEILSVSGPTKTGKTVLIRHVVPNPLMVEGGHVRSFDEFVGAVLDHFGVPTRYEHSAEDERSEGRDRVGHLGSSNLMSVEQKNSETSRDRTGVKEMSSRSSGVAAREALLGGSTPLVIDDFHYIAPNVQLEVVRFLKGLIFEGLPVIFISVPHRAYDVVRVEREMTGRMQVLNVGFWNDDELLTIPRQGFSALNVFDSDNVISRRLVSETFSSPHLMQQFCLRICEENDIAQAADQLKILRQPGSGWPPFFQDRASSSSKSTFDHLARGPTAAVGPHSAHLARRSTSRYLRRSA